MLIQEPHKMITNHSMKEEKMKTLIESSTWIIMTSLMEVGLMRIGQI